MVDRLRGVLPLGVMVLGGVLSQVLLPLAFLIPYIISAMLFLTFLDVRPRDLALQPSHYILLAIQLLASALAYGLGMLLDPLVGAAMLLCFITPAATAGPVIVSLLGGRAGYTTTYVLLSHAMIIVVAPLVLPHVGDGVGSGAGFVEQAWAVFAQVFPLVVPAVALAWLLQWLSPRATKAIARHSWLSYTLWLTSLLLLMGYTVHFIRERDHLELSQVLSMAIVGLVACVSQLALGHSLAGALGADRHAMRHALGQKNTTLSIWLGSLFLPPLTTLATAAYIIWQNVAISTLLARYRQRGH